jgi:uncharacterized protein with HEPN domain
MIIDAVVRNIEIIGEASKNVPTHIKEKLTEVPWTKLAGIRNRIVHEYFGVDINIIWFIVTNELSQWSGFTCRFPTTSHLHCKQFLFLCNTLQLPG